MKNFILFLMLFSLYSCAPKEFIPFEPPELSFNATEQYTLDLSSIKKPDKLNPIFVNDRFEEVPIEQAQFIVLNPKEYSKIGSIVTIASTYKKIAIEQETLINLHIKTINSLKEYLELERNKSLQYRELWVNAENNYRYEKFEHSKDNFINQTSLYGIIIGGLILVAF